MRISDWSSDVCSSDLHELLAPSPFDWASQALCYLPPGLPQPSARDYTAAIAEVLLPVLHASQGRAFVMFASHRALREAAAILQDGPWPLFVKGQAPRAQLLQTFREPGNGRSAARRVGKESVSTRETGWALDPRTKNTK